MDGVAPPIANSLTYRFNSLFHSGSPCARTLLTLIRETAIAGPELSELPSKDGLAQEPE
jgi:hypothetical protein